MHSLMQFSTSLPQKKEKKSMIHPSSIQSLIERNANFLYLFLHLKFTSTTKTLFDSIKGRFTRCLTLSNIILLLTFTWERDQKNILHKRWNEVLQDLTQLENRTSQTPQLANTTKAEITECSCKNALRIQNQGLVQWRLQENFLSSPIGPGQDLEADLRRRSYLFVIFSVATCCHRIHFPALRTDRQKRRVAAFCASSA